MKLYILNLLLYIPHIANSPTKVIIAPHSAYLRSSLNLTQAYEGLSQANSTIAKLEHDYMDNPDITYETKKLVEIVIKTGTLKMERIWNMMNLERFNPSRLKRDIERNPLYGVGNIADWVFGLTSHERFSKMNHSIEDSLAMLGKNGQEIYENVKQNVKVISESSQTLKEFERFLDSVKDNDDKLLKTDRLFLKMVEIKFELDLCLNSLSLFALKVEEIFDQSDFGFPSRFIFSLNYLRSSVVHLNERFPNLSPVIGSDKVDKYFSLPLAFSSFDGTSFHSILKMPLVDDDAQFSISHQNFHEGFITLKSFKYRVMMSFFQFNKCSRKNQNHETLCIFRPCLIKVESSDFFCFALNETSFIISSVENISITTRCDKQVRTIQVPQSKSYSHLSVPSHCQAQSQHFLIRNIETPSSPSKATPFINTILSMDNTRMITNSSSKENQTISLDRHPIPLQLKQSKPRLPDKPAIPVHYGPLSIGGATIGTTAVLSSLILLFWGVIRINRKNKKDKEENDKEEKDSECRDVNVLFHPTGLHTDDQLNLPTKIPPGSFDQSIPDYLPPYKMDDRSDKSRSFTSFAQSIPSVSLSKENLQRTPFCGLLELRCDQLDKMGTTNLCKNCQEIKQFSNEKAFTDTSLGHKIEQNLKNSLNIPYNTAVKIWPHDDVSSPGDTVLLQFAMSITYSEHEDMMTSKMMLIREMTESNIDRVYLHRPVQIWDHWLSLYKVN